MPFLYHIPPLDQKKLHEELFKLPWRRLSVYLFTSKDCWATSLAHPFVVLDSPWAHLNQPAVPCQDNAEARGLHHPDCYCSNLPWHGFDPLQGALGSGTACPGFGTGQTVLSWQFGCSCSLSGANDFRSQDGASTTQLASWPEWILEVLNFLKKM